MSINGGMDSNVGADINSEASVHTSGMSIIGGTVMSSGLDVNGGMGVHSGMDSNGCTDMATNRGMDSNGGTGIHSEECVAERVNTARALEDILQLNNRLQKMSTAMDEHLAGYTLSSPLYGVYKATPRLPEA